MKSPLQVLGIETFQSEPDAEILKKILNDHLVCQRAQELMIRFFAGDVCEQLHPMERAALIKKVLPAARPQGKASWSIAENYSTGALSLKAVCATCRQDVFIRPPEGWREHIPFDRGGTNQGFTYKDHPVTLADVKRSVANLSWPHCGHVDVCPAELAKVWEDKITALVQK